QIGLVRARLREAFVQKDIAETSWLPSINVGTSYTRHEGGIANEDGTLTHSSFGTITSGLELDARLDLRDAVYQQVMAERQLWQQKGELSRVTSETLLEASGTYIALLTAKTAETIALSMQKDLEALWERSKKVVDPEPGASFQEATISSAVQGRRQSIVEL